MQLWFELERCNLDFINHAPFNMMHEVKLPIPPEQVFDILVNHKWEDWFPDFVSTQWKTQEPHGIGSIREANLKTVKARERFLAWEEGKRFCFTIDAVTLPLVNAMAEDIQLTPSGDNSTLMSYRIYYDPKPMTRLIHPLVRSYYGRMFKNSMISLQKYIHKTFNPPDQTTVPVKRVNIQHDWKGLSVSLGLLAGFVVFLGLKSKNCCKKDS